MFTASPSDVEALCARPDALFATGGGISVRAPCRPENLKLLQFLDQSASRADDTVTFGDLGSDGAPDEPQPVSHAVVLSVMRVTENEEPGMGASPYYTDSPIYEECGNAAEEELGAEAVDSVYKDDAHSLCQWLGAHTSARRGRWMVHRIHIPVFDAAADGPSRELLDALLIQFVIRARLDTSVPAGGVAFFVVDVSSDCAQPCPQAEPVAAALAKLASTTLENRVSVHVICSAALLNRAIVCDYASEALLPIRVIDAVSMQGRPLELQRLLGDRDPTLITIFRAHVLLKPYRQPHSSRHVSLAISLMRCFESSDSPYLRNMLRVPAGEPVVLSTSMAGSCSPPSSTAELPRESTFPQGAHVQSPLVLEVAAVIVRWMAALSGSGGSYDKEPFPGAFAPPAVGLLCDDAALREGASTCVRSSLPLVEALVRSSDTVRPDDVAELVKALGSQGIALLLRCRFTPGSVAAITRGVPPLPCGALTRAFRAPHEAGQALTVGARALAKHIHRDQSESWWGPGGELSGTQVAKNAAALAVLHRILSGAVWINVHMLPHNIVAVELRVAEGYGARWVAGLDGADAACDVQFRGFLEPTDPDGHAKGWKH